jgi:hypothetical protein
MKKTILTITIGLAGMALRSQTIPCFTLGVGTPTTASQPAALITADLNSDGKLDVAVANYNSGNVSISFGTGNGSFTAAANYTVNGGPFAIVSGDFNGDGKIDLATTSRSTNKLSILLNQGTGTFTNTASYTTGTDPVALITRDFNADGKLDIITVNNSSDNLYIFLGTGSGTFNAPNTYPCSGSPYGIAAADFDLNGTQDLVVTTLTSNIMLQLSGSGSGTFTNVSNLSTGTGCYYVTTSDFNGDTYPDIAVACSGPSGIQVFLSSGGSFSSNTNYTGGSGPSGITTGDYNGDGFTDIAVGNGGGATNINVVAGSALGTFGPFASFTSGTTPMNIITGDFNGDGKPDLATANYGSSTTSVFINSIAPTVTITPSVTSLCNGNNVTLAGSGSITSYTWSTGATSSSITAAPFFTTTYTLSGTGTNGCLNQAVQTITVYAVPTLDVTPVNSTICAGNSQGISVSGANTYNWSTGSSATFISVSPTTTTVYTVTGTSANGCVSQLSPTVNVNPLPVVSATTATPVCFGGSLNFVNNTTGGSTYSWAGPSSFSSTLANPSITGITNAQTGTYSLSVISSSGCQASTTLSVTVNALPTVGINTATNTVCAGAATTFTASGASTYVWLPGSGTGSTQIFNPTSATTYTVTGTTAQGCSATNTISISTNPLTDFNGTATESSNPVAGKVTLYQYEPFLTKFDSVTTQPLNGTGAYTFTAVPAGDYIVKAVPTASTLQVTYGGSAISWQNANVTSHGCITSSTQNINVAPFFSLSSSGPGSLSGTITQTLGYGQRPSSILSPLTPGQPIGGIVVKGGKNPGGSMFAQTTTDATGSYTLSGLPNGNYFLLVDIPGLDTNLTYHRVISSGFAQYTGLDFTVDSTMVNPVPYVATAIKTNSNSIEQISIYPNPATNQVTIQYTLKKPALVSIEILDVIGQTMKPVLQSAQQDAGMYSNRLTINDLKAGMYFIKVKIDHTEQVMRFMITD